MLMKCAFVNLGRAFGGTENYLLTIIGKWTEGGNEALVIARKNSRFSCAIKGDNSKTQLAEIKLLPHNVFRVRRMIWSNNVDVVHINGINSGVFCCLIKSDLPKVTTVHGNAMMDRMERPRFVQKLFAAVETRCLKKCDKIIAVSSAIKKLLLSRGLALEKICLIPNGVKKIDYLPDTIVRKQLKPIKLCFVGRLEKVKGCHILLQALKELSSYDFQCDIFGEGDERGLLEEYVDENDLKSKVRFCGFSNNVRDVLPEYYAMVVPSLYEASPLILPEAMNAGTLVICSNAGGLPYIIENKKTGYVFETGNVCSLVEVLKKVMDLSEETSDLVKNAYETFLERYTEDVMAEKTLEVLCNVGKSV